MKPYKIFLDSSLNILSNPRIYLKNHPRCKIVPSSETADISFFDPFKKHINNKSFWTNRVQKISQLTHKVRLARLIKSTKYTPKTWRILENKKFPKALHQYLQNNPEKLLVCKPPTGSNGRGITFHTAQELQNNKYKVKKNYLIQEYIDPYLIDNTKFDIRMYVFMDHRGNFQLSRNGVIRFAYTPYSMDSKNPKTFLTNTSISPATCRIKAFRDWDEADFFYPKIKDVVADVVQRFHHVYPSNKKGFHLLGFDIAIQKDKTIKILEINRRPSLKPINDLNFKIKQEMMNDYVHFWDTILQNNM